MSSVPSVKTTLTVRPHKPFDPKTKNGRQALDVRVALARRAGSTTASRGGLNEQYIRNVLSKQAPAGELWVRVELTEELLSTRRTTNSSSALQQLVAYALVVIRRPTRKERLHEHPFVGELKLFATMTKRARNSKEDVGAMVFDGVIAAARARGVSLLVFDAVGSAVATYYRKYKAVLCGNACTSSCARAKTPDTLTYNKITYRMSLCLTECPAGKERRKQPRAGCAWVGCPADMHVGMNRLGNGKRERVCKEGRDYRAICSAPTKHEKKSNNDGVLKTGAKGGTYVQRATEQMRKQYCPKKPAKPAPRSARSSRSSAKAAKTPATKSSTTIATSAPTKKTAKKAPRRK